MTNAVFLCRGVVPELVTAQLLHQAATKASKLKWGPSWFAATALQRTAAAGTLDLAGTKAASSFTHTCPVQRRLEDVARAATTLPATQASRRSSPPALTALPDDRLHSAIVQLLKRRRSRPKHERLSAPPRHPLPGQPPGGDPPPRSPSMPARQPPARARLREQRLHCPHLQPRRDPMEGETPTRRRENALGEDSHGVAPRRRRVHGVAGPLPGF